jgi:hypothetical protein
MTIFDQQLADLKEKTENALIASRGLPSGAYLITVPNVSLPDGWSVNSVTIYFLAPAGYPGAQPDCFWVDEKSMRLKNGATPNASNDINPIPEVGTMGTWFSWHLQSWNPNRDSLWSYFNVIMARFNDLR